MKFEHRQAAILALLIAVICGLGRAEDRAEITEPPTPDDSLAPGSSPELQERTRVGSFASISIPGDLTITDCSSEETHDARRVVCDMVFEGFEQFDGTAVFTAQVKMASDSGKWEQQLYDEYQTCQQDGDTVQGDSIIGLTLDGDRAIYNHETSDFRCVKPNQ